MSLPSYYQLMLPFMKLLFKLNEPMKIQMQQIYELNAQSYQKRYSIKHFQVKRIFLKIEFLLEIQIERSFHIYKIDQDRFDEDIF